MSQLHIKNLSWYAKKLFLGLNLFSVLVVEIVFLFILHLKHFLPRRFTLICKPHFVHCFFRLFTMTLQNHISESTVVKWTFFLFLLQPRKSFFRSSFVVFVSQAISQHLVSSFSHFCLWGTSLDGICQSLNCGVLSALSSALWLWFCNEIWDMVPLPTGGACCFRWVS